MAKASLSMDFSLSSKDSVLLSSDLLLISSSLSSSLTRNSSFAIYPYDLGVKSMTGYACGTLLLDYFFSDVITLSLCNHAEEENLLEFFYYSQGKDGMQHMDLKSDYFIQQIMTEPQYQELCPAFLGQYDWDWYSLVLISLTFVLSAKIS